MEVRFWVKTSRMTDIEEIVEIGDDLLEDEIKDRLVDWCEEVFPMFRFTDAWIRYGYDSDL